MNDQNSKSPAVWWVWLTATVLFVLHQDFWLWNDTTLLFGFMPIGLAYHAAFSIVAAVLWFLAVKFAWPAHIEQWAEQDETGGPQTGES